MMRSAAQDGPFGDIVETAQRSGGTQCLDRAIAILTDLASQSPVGTRLLDIAMATGIARPTARRILKRLMEAGLVVQENRTHLYKLGAFAHAIDLGLPQGALIEVSRPSLELIVRETGQTVLLVSRSGRYSVCCDRIDGVDPAISNNPSIGHVGQAGLLGPSASSVAILASLHDAQIDDILFDNEWMLSRYGGLDLSILQAMIERTRARGYCHSMGEFVPGISGVGVAVPTPRGQTFASLSIVGSVEVVTPEMARTCSDLLHREAALIADALMSRQRGARPPVSLAAAGA